MSYGHIGDRVLAVVVMMLVITSVTSTYMIQYSYELFGWLQPVIRAVGMKTFEVSRRPTREMAKPPEIVFLGFTRAASTLLHELLSGTPTLAESIVVVDFNPVVHEELGHRGVQAIYGDISHADTLHHAGVESARLLISTVPDAILKGTSNERLLAQLKTMAEESAIIVTADQFHDARRLYNEGAAFVYIPRLMSARDLAEVVRGALKGDLDRRRHEAQAELERVEVLP